jgi:hypothetical protein
MTNRLTGTLGHWEIRGFLKFEMRSKTQPDHQLTSAPNHRESREVNVKSSKEDHLTTGSLVHQDTVNYFLFFIDYS